MSDIKCFQSGYVKWKPVSGEKLVGEFDGTLVVNGEVIVKGDVIEVDTTVSLAVSDLFTIMNFGETGPGVVTTVSNNESGMFVDRGMYSLIEDPNVPGNLIVERVGGDPSGLPIWRDDPLANGIVQDDGTVDHSNPGPHLPRPPAGWVWSENSSAWDLNPIVDYRVDQNGNPLPPLQLPNNPRIRNLGDPVDPYDAVNLRTLQNYSLPAGNDNDILYYDATVGAWQARPMDIEYDTSPTLGGNLDVKDFALTTSGTFGDISLIPSGSGTIVLNYGRWPISDGSADSFLTTDGSGNLSWKSLSSLVQPDPYDLTFFVDGNLTTPNYIFTGYYSTEIFTILGDTVSNSSASAQTAPANDVSFDILKNGNVVGLVLFTAGNTQGTVNIGANVPVGPGDIIEIRTQSVIDPIISDLSITLQGNLTSNLQYVPHDYSFYMPDNINTVGTTISRYVAGRDFLIPSVSTSDAHANTPPTVNVRYDLLHNGSVIGTVDFSAGSSDGSVSIPVDVNVTAGDLIELVTTSAIDSFIAGVSITIQGQFDNIANTNPYDIEIYKTGPLDTPNAIFGNVIIAREVTLSQMIGANTAYAEIPPAVDVTYDVLYNGGIVGSVSFTAGNSIGMVNIPSSITMAAGDTISLSTGVNVDATIAEISITIGATVFIDENPFGSVDSVTGGDGLYNDGGTTTGDVTLHVGQGDGIVVDADTVSVLFGGTGSANSVSRSDHTHSSTSIVSDPFIEVTTNYTASVGDHIILGGNTNPITISLPASPTAGDYVRIKTGTALSGGQITISGNGNNINEMPDDIIVDLNHRDLTFVFINSTRGWML